MKFSILGGLILIASRVLAECSDDDAGTLGKCLTTLSSSGFGGTAELFSKKEEVEAFCKNFTDVDDCKNAVPILTKSAECVAKLPADSQGSALKLQLLYLSFCGTDGDNKQCPLAKFITENVSKITDEKAAESEDLKKVLAEDCKNEKCNANMQIAGGIMSQDSIKDAIAILAKGLNAVVQKYKENYEKKTCDAITGNGSDDKDDAVTLKRITFSLIGMILLTSLILLWTNIK